MTAIEHTLLGNNAAWSIDTDGGDGGNQSRRVHAQSMRGGHMGTGTSERDNAAFLRVPLRHYVNRSPRTAHFLLMTRNETRIEI
jgi:hypothetical protein